MGGRSAGTVGGPQQALRFKAGRWGGVGRTGGGDGRIWTNLQPRAYDVSKRIWIRAAAPTSKASAGIHRFRKHSSSLRDTLR